MKLQLTTVRDGARASASTLRRNGSERRRVSRSAERIAGASSRARTTATTKETRTGRRSRSTGLPPEQAATLGRQPSAQSDRGDDREAEEQRARLAADERQPPRGDLAAVVGVDQLVVGTAEPERFVGVVQPALPARLQRERPADVP